MNQESAPSFPKELPQETQEKYTLIKWLNVDDELFQELENTLLGRRYYQIFDKDLGEYKLIEEKIGQRIVNEDGAKEILQFIRMNMNKNIRMTNINRGEVYLMAKNIMTDLNLFIFENAERFDLKPEHYDYLISILNSNIWASLNRAKDGEERREISKTYHEGSYQQISKTEADQPKFRLW